MAEKLRVVFKKGQQAKYISHLDLLRTFIRALRRAEVPVKYSEGFNPHAQLTFALPMAVGVTGDSEVVDITMAQPVDIMQTIKKLGGTMPRGLEIVQANITLANMPDFDRGEYIVTVENETPFADSIKEEIIKAMSQGEIIVEKKTKKKTTMVNIIEHLFDFEMLSAEGSEIVFRMIVSVGNEFTLKPELVLNGISSLIEEFKPVDVDIHRKRILIKGENI